MINALRVGFIATFMAVTVVLLLPIFLVLLPSRVARIQAGNAYGKMLGWTTTKVMGVDVSWEHRERLNASMPAIYVTNHASTLDMFIAMWICPYKGCGVAKREVGNWPFFGQIYRLAGHVLIDRADSKAAIERMNETARFIKENGVGLWIWPEGTRSLDGRLRRFKKGFVHMAVATGLPVVPVVMHGAYKIWPKGPVLGIRPGKLHIEVLEPIDTSGWSRETVAEHADLVHDVIAQHLREDQKPA